MAKAKKVLSVVLVALFTVMTVMSYVPAQAAAKKAVTPQIKIVEQPAAEYTVGDRLYIKVQAPNYSGKVEYRAALWETGVGTRDVWQKTMPAPYYYKNWQPAGTYVFPITWICDTPNTYNLTIYVRPVGSKAAFSSYVKTINFTVKEKEVETPVATIDSIVDITKEVKEGDVYSLPTTVKAIMSDKTEKDVQVTWNKQVVTTTPGTFEFEGTVAGYAKTVKLTLTVTKVDLTVESVAGTNLKELVVKFNKAVDENTVLVGNFTIAGANAADVALDEDGKTVTVTIADAQVSATQPANYAVVVQNVKDLAGNKMAKYSTTARIFDSAVPVAQSVQLTGPNTFEITFSEPMTTAGTVKINNGIYAVTSNPTTGSNVVVVTLAAAALADGNYTIALTGFKDYAGFTIDATTLTLAYAKVTSLPTATIKSAKQNEVVVVFDRTVTLDATYNAGADAYEDYFYHTFSAWQPTSVVADADGKTFTLNFTTFPIPEGTTSLVIKYKGSAGAEIIDAWGNKLASNITLPVTVTADKTAPAVKEVKVAAEDSVEIYFTEQIDEVTAETIGNFAVKDSTGKAVTTLNTPVYTWNAATGTSKLVLPFSSKLTGGNYTVDVKNMKDESLLENVMATVTLPFTITDLTAINPTAVTATYIENTAADGTDIIYVTYPEKMAVTGEYSVLRADKYLVGNSALPTGTTLELFGTTGKVVKISIPDANGGNDFAAVKLYIGRVADLAGNAITQLVFPANNDVNMAGVGAPQVTAIYMTDNNKVKIVVNAPLSVVLPSGFTTNGHSLASIDSWKVNDAGRTEIVATIDGRDAVSATDTSAILASFDVVANILVAETGIKMAAADVKALVVDTRAPRLIATNPIVEGTVDKTIEIKFTEALDTTAGMAALMAHDLVIQDADGNTLIAGVDYTTAIKGGSANILVVTGTTPFTAQTYKVSSKAAITYIADDVTPANVASPFTTVISVVVD